MCRGMKRNGVEYRFVKRTASRELGVIPARGNRCHGTMQHLHTKSSCARARVVLKGAVCKALIVPFLLAVSGCSTMSFSNKDGPFDGTYHSLSALVCSGYWSNRDWQRNDLGKDLFPRLVSTSGLVFYSLVDVPFSVMGDVLFLIPNTVIKGGPSRPAFDVKDHKKPWACGSLSHSIDVIGAL